MLSARASQFCLCLCAMIVLHALGPASHRLLHHHDNSAANHAGLATDDSSSPADHFPPPHDPGEGDQSDCPFCAIAAFKFVLIEVAAAIASVPCAEIAVERIEAVPSARPAQIHLIRGPPHRRIII